MAIGALVMYGWASNIILFIQIDAALVPMQFNTALLMFLSGLALVGYESMNRSLLAIVGATIFTIALLTLSQYAFGINLGLDQFFIVSEIAVRSSYLGRMAPNTAFNFLLAGIAILLLSRANRTKIIFESVGLLAAIISSLALVSLAGFLLNLDTNFGWGNWSQMAVHTTLGFVFLSAGFLTIYMKHDSPLGDLGSRSFPLMVGVGSITTALSIWRAASSYNEYLVETFGEDRFWPFDDAVLIFGLIFSASLFAAVHLLQKSISNEREAKLAHSDLVSSEKMNVSIVDTISEGIITIDRSGIIQSINRSAEDIFGYASSDAVGKNIKFLMPERYSQYHDTYIENYHNTGEKKIIGSTREVRGLRKNGTIFPMLLQVFESKSEGNFTYVGVVNDITERHRLELELLKSQKLESIGQIAGAIAHDFNNALAEIQINASVGLGTDGVTPELAEILNSIEESVESTMGITRQFITFSKGGTPLLKPTEIRKFLENTVQFALSGSSLNVQINVEDNISNANIDRGQITQVMSNLIRNAHQAMKSGGMLRVKAQDIIVDDQMNLGMLAPGVYVKVSIIDQGVGIAPEDIDKIFDPFHTSKSLGDGLGLFSCYKIIRSHNGWITAESELDLGSTFSFYLPSTNEPEISMSASKSLRGSGKILIMDDKPKIQVSLVQLLEQLGYEATATADGEAALHAYQQATDSGNPFDLCILDLTVPDGMGGQETSEKLRMLNPDVKLVVASGYADEPIMADYKAFGFQGAMLKPFKKNELAAVVKAALRNGAS